MDTKRPVLRVSLSCLGTGTHSVVDPIIYDGVSSFDNLVVGTRNRIITNRAPLCRVGGWSTLYLVQHLDITSGGSGQ